MARLTNQEIVEAMVQLEDKIEKSFTSVARAMEMVGEMVEFLSKRLDEMQADVELLQTEVDLLKKKAKKKQSDSNNPV